MVLSESKWENNFTTIGACGGVYEGHVKKGRPQVFQLILTIACLRCGIAEKQLMLICISF